MTHSERSIILTEDSILDSRKFYQRNKILYLIRTESNVSRNDIKKLTSYSMTTVLKITDEMIKDNLIFEEECIEARVGRKPVWLRLNPEGGFFIGIEFNRRKMHCNILNFTTEVIYRDEHYLSDESISADELLTDLCKIIERALEWLGGKSGRVIGIGIGVPGYSNPKTGVAISYKFIQNWDHIPIKKIIEEKFNFPCFVDNNINAMIYAYKWIVYKGNCDNMIFISIRTGIRAMPVINNSTISSTFGFPGELGHIKLSGKNRLCMCGQYGCLNSEASEFAIINKITEWTRIGKLRYITTRAADTHKNTLFSLFIRGVQERDKDCLELLEQVTKYLGDGLAIMINLFAPQRIVLFGELTKTGEPFLQFLKNRISEKSLAENIENLEISTSPFGPDLGASGAACLVMQEAFAFIEEAI